MAAHALVPLIAECCGGGKGCGHHQDTFIIVIIGTNHD